MTGQLGPYEVLGQIGRGAMGVVLRARAPDGREVAIKLLHETRADARARFERERRLLWSFAEADGFVPVIDAGEHGGRPYHVMPLIPGGTLRERLARGPFAIDEAVSVVEALARALGRAHERGVVHRDLKPENVLFTHRGAESGSWGAPLVTDLGLARHFRTDVLGASQSAALSKSGSFLGTAGYMSPEQMRDAHSALPSADIFALGAILHECVSGELPFAGETPLELIARVEEGRVTPLRRLRAETPAWLEALVLRTLARDPAARFADGGALARALAARGAGARRTRAPLLAAVAASVALLLAGVGAWHRARGASFAALPSAALPLPGPPPRSGGGGGPGRGPDSPWDKLESRFASGETLRAEELDAALEKDGASARGWLLRARVRWRARDVAGAEADLEKAVERDAAHARVWLEWAAQLGDDARFAPVLLSYAERTLRTTPANPVAIAARGGALIDLGRAAEGFADLDRAVGLDPSLVATRYMRAVALMKAGRHAPALEDLNAALEVQPGFGPALVARAQIRSAAGDVPGAFADAKLAVERTPADPLVWATLGHVQVKRRELAAAATAFQRSVELAPGALPPLIDHAEVLAMQGDLAGAAAELSRVLELAPDNHGIRTLRAELLWKLEDKAGALAEISRVLEATPRDVRARLFRGNMHELGGELDAAIADYEAAIEAAPKNAAAFRGRGSAFSRKGDARRAVASYSTCLELEPDDVKVLGARAVLRNQLGDLEGALADATRVTVLAPADSEAWLNRASFEEGLVRFEAAALSVDRLVASAPRDAMALRRRAFMRRRLGLMEGALADLDRALELEPRDASHWSVRSGFRQEALDPKGALEDAERAVALDPGSWDAYRQRGSVRADAGDRTGALADLALALSRKEPNAFAYVERAMILASEGRVVEALADCEAAIAKDAGCGGAFAVSAIITARRGEHERALALAEKAISVGPLEAVGYEARAEARLRAGRLDGAIDDADRALVRLARSYAVGIRGLARKAKGEMAAARRDLDDALRRRIGDPSLAKELAKARDELR